MSQAMADSRGQTLIETLVAIVLFSFVFSGLIAFFLFGNNMFAHLLNQTDVQYSVRSSVGIIGQDVRGGRGIELLAKNTELRLTAWNGNQIRYYCYNNQLYREQINNSGAVRIPVAENITSLGLARYGQLLMVNISATKEGAHYELSTGFYLRIIQQG